MESAEVNGRHPGSGRAKANRVDGLLNESKGMSTNGKPPIVLSFAGGPLGVRSHGHCQNHQCGQENVSNLAHTRRNRPTLSISGGSQPPRAPES